METMKAAVVNEACDPGALPCHVKNVTKPVPKDTELLVQMKANGCCHTDLHAIAGDWPLPANFPLVPGHEGVGIVVSKGSGVTHFELGDRVGISWLHTTCGACEFCVTGWETLCPHQKNCGYSVAGTMSEYSTVDAAYAVRIPQSLSSEQAAPIICAGVTAYKAIKMTEARSGQFLVVSGAAGGIGHLACQYGKAMGLRVIAVDVGAEKKQFCEGLGVELAINIEDAQAAGDSGANIVKEYTGGGAHAVVCCAPHPAAYKSAIFMLRRRGAMVCLGLPHGSFEVPLVDLVLKALTIRGSIVGTRQDMREALDFAARGLVCCNVTTAHMNDINEVMQKLKCNQIDGRVVLHM